eukprot:UN25288
MHAELDGEDMEKRVRTMDWIYHDIEFFAASRPSPVNDNHEIWTGVSSIIQSVRLMKMYIDVVIIHPPFVLYPDEINGELEWKTGEFGDDNIFHLHMDTNSKDDCMGWRIHVCEMPFNYTSNSYAVGYHNERCFDEPHLKTAYPVDSMFLSTDMDVDKEVYSEQFGFFLDETLFPADPDNDPIRVDVITEFEILYNGNVNPVRRKLQSDLENPLKQSKLRAGQSWEIYYREPEIEPEIIPSTLTSTVELDF